MGGFAPKANVSDWGGWGVAGDRFLRVARRVNRPSRFIVDFVTSPSALRLGYFDLRGAWAERTCRRARPSRFVCVCR